MTPDEAHALVESIRAGLIGLTERIQEAYEGRAWVALGYGSWAIMCQQEFGGGIELPSGKRREVVAELSAAGISQRAIGQALGVHRRTVDRDEVAQDAPPAPVIGLDGKRYTPPAPRPKPDPPPPARDVAIRDAGRELVRALYWFTDLDRTEIGYLRTSDRQTIRDQCHAVLHLLDEENR
jgi:hypothetical protein